MLLRCQGKLLQGSGPDDVLVECAVFGPSVIESVLNCNQYVRALIGILTEEDLIHSLLLQMFWHCNNKAMYPELTEVEIQQTTLA